MFIFQCGIEMACRKVPSKRCASGRRVYRKSKCKSRGKCVDVYRRYKPYKQCKSYQARVNGRCRGSKRSYARAKDMYTFADL